MKRSKRIALVTHCLLNQNARAKGVSKYASIHPRMLAFMKKNNIGLLQLPCPEIPFTGIDRAPKDQEYFDRPEFHKIIKQIAHDAVSLVKRYLAKGYQFYGLIGVSSSPSCGLEFIHCRGKKLRGQGLLIEELREQMVKAKITLKTFVV